MSDVQPAVATMENPVVSVEIRQPRPTARFGRLLLVLVLLLAVIGLAAWQVLSLHHRIHQVQGTVDRQAQELKQSTAQFQKLQSSVNAAVGCLEVAKPQPTLCSRFLP